MRFTFAHAACCLLGGKQAHVPAAKRNGWAQTVVSYILAFGTNTPDPHNRGMTPAFGRPKIGAIHCAVGRLGASKYGTKRAPSAGKIN